MAICKPPGHFVAVIAGLCAVPALLFAQQAAPLQFNATQTNLTLHASNDVAVYYLVEQSTNLLSFAPWSLRLGDGGPSWSVGFDSAPEIFFRGRWFSLYAPGDMDGDGLDDVWELEHGLNPLDPTDAGHTNPATGLTWLQEYQTVYGRKTPKNEAISRELTVRLYPPDAIPVEAISRELSLRLYPIEVVRPEAISSEVSLYIGERAPNPLFPDVTSREVSLRLYPPEVVKAEAVTREVSLYLGERAPNPAYPDVVSREVSIRLYPPDDIRPEAISREISIYNGEAAPAN